MRQGRPDSYRGGPKCFKTFRIHPIPQGAIMKKLIPGILVSLAASATAITFLACGKQAEAQKTTTVIERTVVVQEPAKPAEDGHLQRAGGKIDAKVDRKIDEALDKAIGK
jgi:hypothetical protein